MEEIDENESVLDKNVKLDFENIKALMRNTFRINKIIWRKHKALFSLLGLTLFTVSFLPFLRANINGKVIDILINFLKTNVLSTTFPFFLATYLIIDFVYAISGTTSEYIGYRFYKFLEETFMMLIIGKKSELDIGIHESANFNDFANKVDESGIWHVQNFADRQFYILQNLLRVVIAAVIVIRIKWWLVLIILVGTIPEIIKEIKYGQNVWTIWDAKSEVRRKYAEYKHYFATIPSLSEIKLFGTGNYFYNKIQDLFRSFNSELSKGEKKKYKLGLFTDSISQAAMSIVSIYFIFDVIHGNLTIGNLTFLLASVGNLHGAFANLFSFLGRQYQDSLFVTDLFKLIDQKPSIDYKKEGVVLDNTTPKIEFKDVTFKYPGTDKIVLKNFSLTINPGEKIAFVGVNGAGKTTLIKLLSRFYDPTKGKIFIGGYDLKDLEINSWYEKLSILSQEYIKYYLLAKEAIGVGDVKKMFNEKLIKEAAKASEAHAFIEEWEHKYDQMLGKIYKEGKELSIGQWQKLALARIFYRNSPIMILDEPTSSIDAEAEKNVFERLTSLPDDRTVILISHRFSTVRYADKICVISEGELKEYGTHEELIKIKDGLYQKAFNLQAEGYR